MYASRIPFTRDTNKGPKEASSSKKSSKPVKIEEIDLITEPETVVPEEPVVEETAEETLDGND